MSESIYKYINSNSIAEYLKKQEYKFSPLEAAWLIYQCEKVTLEEKHKAWSRLISSSEDCPISERRNCNYQPSLHKFLQRYIEIEDRSAEKLKDGTDSVYMYRVYIDKKDQWTEETIFSSYKECWKAMKDDLDSYEKIQFINIKKYKLNESRPRIEAKFNTSKELTFIEDFDLTEEEQEIMWLSFAGLWFDFPTPFKKGDIVRKKGDDKSCVLEDIVTWDCKDFIREDGDTTDMMFSAYFIDDEGHMYLENEHNYVDLEYYDEPSPIGYKRMLKSISDFIKEEISLEELLREHRKLLMLNGL